jgi:hypothetical protein
MGFARRRTGRGGRPRYTAYYADLRGRETSAGTFGTKTEADKAWQRAEAKVAEGRAGTGARGRQTFRRYVEQEWLPHHVMEPSTREGYTYSLYAHAIDWFGDMRMIDILPSHVREWVSDLKDKGLSPGEPPAQQGHPVRGLHHGAQRPGHRAPPLQGREDADRSDQAAAHRHAGRVRGVLPSASPTTWPGSSSSWTSTAACGGVS